MVTGLVVFFRLITSAVPYAMALAAQSFNQTCSWLPVADVHCDPQNAEKAQDLLARLAI